MNKKHRKFLQIWRIFPKIKYTNFRKKYSNIGRDCFTEWFSIERFWGGRIIEICVKHRQISLDFRRNWVEDMIYG